MRAALTDTDGQVVNVIVYDPDSDYTPPNGLTLDELADESPVGPGWTRNGDGTYAPPPVRDLIGGGTIPPDGKTTATATYRDTHDDAPATVTFDVNGTAAIEPLVDGEATIEVASTTPGDTITVTADALPGHAVTITVEEA